MTPNDLLTFYGSKSEIARALGGAPSTISEWFDTGEVPEGRQYQAELATGGLLRASKPADRRPGMAGKKKKRAA